MKINLRKTVAFILSALMLFTLLPMPKAQASPAPISLGSAELNEGKYYYGNAVVNLGSIRTILINFSGTVTPGDEIILPTAPAGFTVSASSNAYTKRINLADGTVTADVQSYLRAVGFNISSASQTVQVVVTTEDIQHDTYYNSVTQHYYQFVPLLNGDETWISSYNAAKGMSYMGRTGYLATVTSLQEDTFIRDLSGNVGWLGGTRMTYNAGSDTFDHTATTVYWYWANGPEKGNRFYEAQYVTEANYAATDTANSAYYFNWNRPDSGAREPNSNVAGGETCLTTLFIGTGYQGTSGYSWNDRDYDANHWDDTSSEYQPYGFVVEYGNQTTGHTGGGSEAFATASGTLTDPSQLELTTVARPSASTYTCDINLPVSARMITISVNSGDFTVPSLGGVLTFLGGTKGTSYISAFNTSTQYDSATFSFANPSAAEDLLDDIVYTPGSGTTQTITATSSAVSPAGSDLYFGGHFYRYVAVGGGIDWPSAVLDSGGTTDPYFGGRGYIATATTQAENSILLRLTDNSGGEADHWNDAWMGGLWQRYTGTLDIPSITRGTDGNEISYAILSGATSTQRRSLLLDYTAETSFGVDVNDACNGSADGKFIYQHPEIIKYYWIDGPEAGQEISNNVTDGFSPWHSGEPNSGDFVYIGWEGAYWDDLGADVSAGDNVYATLSGYILEFSGFDGGSTAGIIKSTAKTVNSAYTITYNLDSGTNPGGAPASYTYGTGATLPTPTKGGFTFDGWYADSGFSGTAVTSIGAADSGNKTYFAKWTEDIEETPPSKTLTVTETSSDLFAESPGAILAEANVNNAFSSSVEVKVTDTEQDIASFGFGAGTEVYPFDISLYVKGTDTKTQPASGYAVTISLPVPQGLLDVKEQLFIVHKADNGIVTTLNSRLNQKNGVWYLVFEATEFSPYALAVNNLSSYNSADGLPYYLNEGIKTFIGFAANGKYLAPSGVTVLLEPNPKNFSDIATHWGKPYIDFVTEREVFVGTAENVFSPETGMTRAMFATVIGRLYERSYDEISLTDAHAFSDCSYDDYYGKYVDWAAKNGIIQGVGGSLFQPDRQVSRQEIAAMLFRFANFLKLPTSPSANASLSYSDSSRIASWAQSAALYCQETGIIAGRSGGSFAPTETATRTEVAAIIQRFVGKALN